MTARMPMKTTIALAACVVGLWPVAAGAHPMPGVGDFYAGMLHPVTTIEFVLPLIALGLLAGQQNRTTAINMLVTIPVMLALGAVVGFLIPVPHAIGWVNVSSMAVLGLLVAAAPTLPLALAIGLTALPALTIGWANGTEIGDQISAYRFIPGVALAGAMLVTYGIGAVRRLRAPWMRIAFRVVGSWIAAVGILVLGLG